MADNIDMQKDDDPMSEESDMDAYKILEAETTLEPKDNPVKKKVKVEI
jgi:hypothetical protein